jgi:hypothetical protein
MKKSRRSRWGLLYKFHRYTGLTVGVIILMLSVTGIILNHTDNLQLDQQFVKSPAILDWYGIAAPKLQNSFPIQQHWLTQSGEQIFLDTKPVYQTQKFLIGATMNGAFIAAAFNDSLLLLTLEGKVIEQINKKSIQKIGREDEDRIYIKSQDIVYFSDDALLSWQIADHPPLQWSITAPLPGGLKNRLTTLSRNTILPYERVILDIHSGRFFGTYGIFIIDLAGILFILLAISGTWIWLKHKLRFIRKAKR